MREIKFRVWNPRHKMFKVWGFIKSMFCGIPTGAGLTIDYCKEHSQQYTGLKDKNGKEIYEGDVIKNGVMRGVVRFDLMVGHMAFSGYTTRGSTIALNDCVVIGNIYENPELLEKK